VPRSLDTADAVYATPDGGFLLRTLDGPRRLKADLSEDEAYTRNFHASCAAGLSRVAPAERSTFTPIDARGGYFHVVKVQSISEPLTLPIDDSGRPLLPLLRVAPDGTLDHAFNLHLVEPICRRRRPAQP
jgi:hypothetical protein